MSLISWPLVKVTPSSLTRPASTNATSSEAVTVVGHEATDAYAATMTRPLAPTLSALASCEPGILSPPGLRKPFVCIPAGSDPRGNQPAYVVIGRYCFA